MTRSLAYCLACLPLTNCTGAEPPDGRTRAGLISAYELVLASHDSDDDGKLSLSEVEAMVNSSLSAAADTERAPNHSELRDWLIQDYAAQDINRDGYLSLTELLKEPLATFACMDTNSDGAISESEVQATLGRCDTGQAYVVS